MTAHDFDKLDRDARLVILAEVQHHAGIESEEYCKLARTHEFLLNRANGRGVKHQRIMNAWRTT